MKKLTQSIVTLALVAVPFSGAALAHSAEQHLDQHSDLSAVTQAHTEIEMFHQYRENAQIGLILGDMQMARENLDAAEHWLSAYQDSVETDASERLSTEDIRAMQIALADHYEDVANTYILRGDHGEAYTTALAALELKPNDQALLAHKEVSLNAIIDEVLS